MSLLLLDLGNTRLKLAAAEASGPGSPLALPHGEPTFAAGLDAALAHWPAARQALLASVAPPPLTDAVLGALARRGIAAQRVHVTAARPDLQVCYPQPQRFGVDRWLALLGARRHVPDAALLLAACGTALTLDLVDAGGRHHGGLIAPSPALMHQALQDRAPHLPAAPEAAHAGSDFACDTAPALAAGCTGAALGLIERSLHRAHALLGAMPRLLFTGGGAAALHAVLQDAPGAPPSYHPWLVLDGLAVLAREHAAAG